MSIRTFRDHLIERGLTSVREHEIDTVKIAGGIEGFEMCRDLLTLAEYERLLAERHWREASDFRLGDKTAYWHYRTATAQIEFVYERLRIAYWDAFGAWAAGEGPFSGLAIRNYAKWKEAAHA